MTLDEKRAFLKDAPPGLDATLGVQYETLTPEEVVAVLDVGPAVHQPLGYLHGGVSIALAESVASVGGFLAAPDDHAAFGMTVAASHLRPVRDGRLRAVATPAHSGRTSQVWDVRITDAHDRAVALVRVTLAIVPSARS